MDTATGIYHTNYRNEMAIRHTKAEYTRLLLLVVFLAALPWLISGKWPTVVNQIGIAAIGAVGLNILTGLTGQISLGQGGFLAVGAYTSGLLVVRAGFPTGVAIIIAIITTGAIGAFFGLPALRLKGLYLAIATLASQFIILWAVRNLEFVTGGVDSLVVPRPELFGFSLNSDFRWYWVILGFAVLAVLAATNLMRTQLGRAFVAVRDQDIAAEVIGVNVGRYKLLAFAVSSGFVGLAGALIASYRGIVTWERFELDVSILYLAMIIVGGLGSVAGSVYGAAFILAMPAFIDTLGEAVRDWIPQIVVKLPAIQLGIFGLVIVLFLIFEPEGLARMWKRSKDYIRLWPFRY
jgi:branched-chain amino acid transport system permease protein